LLTNFDRELQKYPEALEVFQQAIVLNPKDKQVMYNMATLYYTTKNYNEALIHFMKVLQFDHLNPSNYYNILFH
jgi:tetratricopeptide (TPR) repeat protein